MSKSGLHNLNALIVDDNQHMLELLGTILNTFGFGSVGASPNAEDAWTLIQSSKPDIIFTDLFMQPVDGIAFTRRLRTDIDSFNPFVPVIMISGHANAERVHLARNAGVSEFLAKPVSPANVLSRIRSVIESPRPFVRTDDYFGPDRRRAGQSSYSGVERRKNKNSSPDIQMQPRGPIPT